MQKNTGIILTILLVCLLGTACAREEEKGAAKSPGKIAEFNKKNADAMVKKIRTPLDKARLTQGLGDQRLEEMDRELQTQR